MYMYVCSQSTSVSVFSGRMKRVKTIDWNCVSPQWGQFGMMPCNHLMSTSKQWPSSTTCTNHFLSFFKGLFIWFDVARIATLYPEEKHPHDDISNPKQFVHSRNDIKCVRHSLQGRMDKLNHKQQKNNTQRYNHHSQLVQTDLVMEISKAWKTLKLTIGSINFCQWIVTWNKVQGLSRRILLQGICVDCVSYQSNPPN